MNCVKCLEQQREPEGDLGGHWVSDFREDFSQKTLKGRRWSRGAQESTCNMWDVQAVWHMSMGKWSKMRLPGLDQGDSLCSWVPKGGPVAASASPGDFRHRVSGSILNFSIYSADPWIARGVRDVVCNILSITEFLCILWSSTSTGPYPRSHPTRDLVLPCSIHYWYKWIQAVQTHV